MHFLPGRVRFWFDLARQESKKGNLLVALLTLSGAACRNRTGDLFITNELLYQLS